MRQHTAQPGNAGALFWQVKSTTEDAPCMGHPVAATSSQIVTAAKEVESDDRCTCDELAEELEYRVQNARHVLTVALQMRKLITKWNSHIRTDEQMELRDHLCLSRLRHWRKEGESFHKVLTNCGR